MDDLQYILGIGFSGTDIARAFVLAFFLALVVGAKRSIWLLGLIALVIDRLVWPIAQQAGSGAGIHTIYASIGALGQTFVDDLGLYLVRYLGLVIMIGVFRKFRSQVQGVAAPKKAAA